MFVSTRQGGFARLWTMDLVTHHAKALSKGSIRGRIHLPHHRFRDVLEVARRARDERPQDSMSRI